MLQRLLETKQVKSRKPGGTAVSVVLHLALLAAAVQLAGKDGIAATKPEAVPVKISLDKKPVKPDTPEPLHVDASKPSPFGHQVLTAPPDIPVDIPAVDLSATPTNALKYTGEGVPGGTHAGTDTSGMAVAPDQPLFVFEVDKVAAAIPGTSAPSYPELLKASGIEGDAMVQFVVDTLGRAEPGSFKVLRSTHEAFGASVRVALPRMRFLPAEARGKKVRMLVQQTFAFALNR
jgi:TonB family protein